MSGGPHLDPSNKRIALLIALLALVLAITETLGKGAQTNALSANIEASNLWNFFQAKTVRMTTVRTAAEELEVQLATVADPVHKAAMEKRIADWQASAKRYDTEPETKEGRRELAARAKTSETKRDLSLAAYHHFEVGSAAVQIAIVLASATILTNATILAYIAGALGLIGIFFAGIGLIAPQSFHLFH